MICGISTGVLVFGPVCLDSLDYPTPLTIPGTNSTVTSDFLVNYAFQFYMSTIMLIFMCLYPLIFFIFTSHIRTEIQITYQVAEGVGEYEEEQYVKRLKERKENRYKSKLDPVLLQEICGSGEEDALQGPSTSNPEADETLDESDEIYQFLSIDQTKNSDNVISSEILKNIIIMHNDIIRWVNFS